MRAFVKEKELHRARGVKRSFMRDESKRDLHNPDWQNTCKTLFSELDSGLME